MTNRKGFTLIELLVVIAIIGILSTIAVVALNTARSKSRDAKRIADVKQMQTALELYFNDQDEYPVADTDVADSVTTQLGQGAYMCLGTAGFAVTGCTGAYMASVPINPGPDGDPYEYVGTTTTYLLTFELMNSTGGLDDGTDVDALIICTATPGSLTCI